MRFIHTADWHLGNTMHGIERAQEQREFLDWLKFQICEQKADALVVAGDIFDVANPSNEAKSIYFSFLASVVNTGCKNIIIVGGNHDSASLLDAPKDVLDFLNIQVVGSSIDRNEEELVREMFNSEGEAIGVCAMIPFIKENELRKYEAEEDQGCFADRTHKKLYQTIAEIAEAKRNGRNIPILATGQLYASQLEGRPQNDTGEGMQNHGVRDIVGNLGTVSVSVFPKQLDYVALGHIHYTTMVAKNPKVRYSGSPFVLGFDEASIPRHILLVDSEKGEDPIVCAIDVPQYFNFVRVEGSDEQIRNTLIELKLSSDAAKTKIEIVYEFVYGRSIRDTMSDIIDGAAFEVVSWKTKRHSDLSARDFADESIENIRDYDEKDIFEKFILSCMNKKEKDDDAEKILAEIMPMFETLSKEVDEDDTLGK